MKIENKLMDFKPSQGTLEVEFQLFFFYQFMS